MMHSPLTSRRAFLALSAATPFALRAASSSHIPVGLELYSVRDELGKDPMGTVRAVGKMGYQLVEFYAPYYKWTPEQAKDMRKLMDDIGLRCNSTHNGVETFTGDGLGKAIDLNHILGSKYVVMAHPGKVSSLDEWKGVAGKLSDAETKLAAAGLHAGYHNHQLEFVAIDGKRPMEVLAANTPEGSDAAVRCRHLRTDGLGPCRVDQCKPRTYPLDASERLCPRRR